MESMSLSGRVQCTHRAAALLAQQDPKVSLLRRGDLTIKGKVSYTATGYETLSEPEI
jgi:hypothetical protein